MSQITQTQNEPTIFALAADQRAACDAIEQAFEAKWTIVRADSGERSESTAVVPLTSDGAICELISAVGRRRRSEVIAEDGGIAIVAIPIHVPGRPGLVCVRPFITAANAQAIQPAGWALLGGESATSRSWANREDSWSVRALERLAAAALQIANDQRKIEQVARESEQISANLVRTYEEISLLHAVSQNLRISASDEELGELALNRLIECVPAKGLAILYPPLARQEDVTYRTRTENVLLQRGECVIQGSEAFVDFLERFQIDDQSLPTVINRNRHERADLLPDGIDQVVVAPLQENSRAIGYLFAFNHSEGLEFGTVEANMLASVSSMLGIHGGNRNLYREQAEFLASVVRALVSAIDAKDRYTCGHSDRVARIAVCIAKQLGCDTRFLATIYMSGLLHDIGKIGIDDAVLRKPDKLTDAEFEHIKEHPALGYKILADIKQLSSVLPAVLHHHEQWDGRGYPCKLAGDQIPYIARILAVADAYDAMTSDRPYRAGMPEDRVEKIFREGAGKQWDKQVVDAFFAGINDVRNIRNASRADLTLDIEQWL